MKTLYSEHVENAVTFLVSSFVALTAIGSLYSFF